MSRIRHFLALALFVIGALSSLPVKAAEQFAAPFVNSPDVVLSSNVPIYVYGSRFLDADAVVKMSGLDSDPTITPLEAKRRLETTSLFSRVTVWKDEAALRIIVR